MPFNGSGVYAAPALPGSWNPATTGSSATPADWNTLLADISTALSTTITKDGQTTITADIPMATHKLTGLGNGSALTDSIAFGQTWSRFGTVQTVAAVATIDFTSIPTNVNNLHLTYRLSAGTLSSTIFLQFFSSTGSPDTGAHYEWSLFSYNPAASALAGTSGTSNIVLTGQLGTGGTGVAAAGNIWINFIQNPAIQCNSTVSYLLNDNATINGAIGQGGYGNTFGPITGVRIGISAGTFTGNAALMVS